MHISPPPIRDKITIAKDGTIQWSVPWIKWLDSVVTIGTVHQYATAERPDATQNEGMIIYNSTTSKHQGSDGSTWNDLY